MAGVDIGNVGALPHAVALLVGVGQCHLLCTGDAATSRRSHGRGLVRVVADLDYVVGHCALGSYCCASERKSYSHLFIPPYSYASYARERTPAKAPGF